MATLTTLPLELRQLIGCLDHKVWMKLAQVDKRFWAYASTPEGQKMFEDVFSEVRLTHQPLDSVGRRGIRIQHFLCGRPHRRDEPSEIMVNYMADGTISTWKSWSFKGDYYSDGRHCHEINIGRFGSIKRAWKSAGRPYSISFHTSVVIDDLPVDGPHWIAVWGEGKDRRSVHWEHPYEESQWERGLIPPQ